MKSDTSKKLFIFLGVLFGILMIGPYLGIHLLGDPEIPERQSHSTIHGLPPEPMLDPELLLDGEDAVEDTDELGTLDDGEDQ